jgi:Domain of unknown function (DUF4114)
MHARALRRAVGALIFVVTTSTTAYAQVPVVFGQSWDGIPLQSILDQRYGTNHFSYSLNYSGASTGDPDPWFWVADGFSALLVREVAGNANRNILGWYAETDGGYKPTIDGIDDGVVFDGPAGAGATAIVMFDRPHKKFGFYLNPNGTGNAINAPEPELFFTNRRYNDIGPDGHAALHAPFDGDVQAIVYDVSSYTQPNTWLVCFEDLDSGANPGPCCSTTDNDFNDFVFEVTALGPTPNATMTFGGIKARYR